MPRTGQNAEGLCDHPGWDIYRTREEARQDVFDYIEIFYNPKRKNARNGILSPAEFERQQMMRREVM